MKKNNRVPQCLASQSACACGGAQYAQCCGRLIDDGAIAASAEQLMRSRYTAYTLGDQAYIARTWAARTRMPVPDAGINDDARWLGLEVRAASTGGDTATVEFVARYKIGGRAQRLHEISRFVRENGQWFYLDGSFPESRTTP